MPGTRGVMPVGMHPMMGAPHGMMPHGGMGGMGGMLAGQPMFTSMPKKR